jgi:hypothetical protein
MQLSTMRPSAMQPSEFTAYHLPALERDEAKHNLIVAGVGQTHQREPTRVGMAVAWRAPPMRHQGAGLSDGAGRLECRAMPRVR